MTQVCYLKSSSSWCRARIGPQGSGWWGGRRIPKDSGLPLLLDLVSGLFQKLCHKDITWISVGMCCNWVLSLNRFTLRFASNHQLEMEHRHMSYGWGDLIAGGSLFLVAVKHYIDQEKLFKKKKISGIIWCSCRSWSHFRSCGTVKTWNVLS